MWLQRSEAYFPQHVWRNSRSWLWHLHAGWLFILSNGFVFVSAVWPPICHGCIFFVSCICFLLEVTTLLLVYFWYVCVWVFFFCLCELVITAVWVSHLLKCVWDGHAIAAWDLLQIFLCDVPSVLRVTQLQRCQHGTELDNLFSSKCSTLIYKCIHSAHTYSKHTYPHTQTLN